MKATGIVRRIDDLGRIVVPKEIRRTLRVREGEPMEIFTGREGEIVLKKYSPMGELTRFAREYAQVLSQMTGFLVCISDQDQILAASGSGQKDYEGKGISRELEEAIAQRETISVSEKEAGRIKITGEDTGKEKVCVIVPILSQGDAIGAVILLDTGKHTKVSTMDDARILVQVAAGFLGKQME
ncbi:MAG: stage V sporulation T C-terminal domain-containing protein [Lachnospiraceae bacterium]|nr:stage V sporulation T C-terminal domain-containing protein [Lachnospiraceae bacterium]